MRICCPGKWDDTGACLGRKRNDLTSKVTGKTLTTSTGSISERPTISAKRGAQEPQTREAPVRSANFSTVSQLSATA
ncbi:hypothetical protein THIOM_003554 [Candidatus Thiomargarita nelsonii]|uniref:Uncharacterized protein n=1 Tax=Candidatus Thiomargarita nelsonii TaxID=1003181 RepID=A0A176RY54_9GAMM|nr:hypothetical protein THIOM_003554 [Candidatus Thiomargarita nelsonii]